jgi:ankyrin repeat protein
MNVDILWKALTADNISESTMKILLKTYPELLNNLMETNNTLLHSAIVKKDQKLAFALIKCSAVDKNKFGQGCTPLTVSIKSNEPDIAIALINAGVDINPLKNMDHIHYIIDVNKRNQVKSFLESNLKLQVKIEPIEEKKITAEQLSRLIQSCNADTKLLTTIIGAHKDILNDGISGFTNLLFRAAVFDEHLVCQVLIEQGVDINRLASGSTSALICAIDNRSFDCAEQLILSGAKTDIRDKYGKTALDYALTCSSNRPKLIIIRELLEARTNSFTEKPAKTKPVEPASKTEESSAPVISVSEKTIKFISNKNLDYSFSNNEITIETNGELVAFALEHNIPYKVSGAKLIIALK